jgi:hypothetical protein
MKLIWSFKSLPELANLPSVERRAIWRWCYWKSFSKWPVWVALAGMGICSVLGEHFGGVIGGVIGAGLGGGIFGLVAVNIARAFVPNALLECQKNVDG